MRIVENLPPVDRVPRSEWPVHLKRTTTVNLAAVRRMVTLHDESQQFLTDAVQYLTPAPYIAARTPRTLKSTSLSAEQVQQYVDFGKAEPCPSNISSTRPLPPDYHGVSMWLHPELKRRFRVINEPALNAWIRKQDLPKPRYPSRLERRHRAEHCRYLLQIDFDAYYNSIELPVETRRCFVFRKNDRVYQLTTLPTGGRWSVAVGQAITWVLTDIVTPCVVLTMIDNVLVGGHLGQEREFCLALRTLLRRMQEANLTTTPPTTELLALTDEQMLAAAQAPVTFLGETFTWDATRSRRVLTNSTKTVAKVSLALRKRSHTFRTFAALVSLLLYGMHTLNVNPSQSYSMMSVYRAMSRLAQQNGGDWDHPMSYLSPTAREDITRVGNHLLANAPVPPRLKRLFSYDEHQYAKVIFIDASAYGWGAFVHDVVTGTTTGLQRMWQNELFSVPLRVCPNPETTTFCVKHSAHAEPTAIYELLLFLQRQGELPSRVAVVTDHAAIPYAQMKTNGFGGIGRGKALNQLFRFVNDLQTNIHFFYISGSRMPADELSRHFGDGRRGGQVHVLGEQDVGLPPLATTFCPVLRPEEHPTWMR